jgi:hypothetical protein
MSLAPCLQLPSSLSPDSPSPFNPSPSPSTALPKILVVDMVFRGLDLLFLAVFAANRAIPPSSIHPLLVRRPTYSSASYHRPCLCFIVFLVHVFVLILLMYFYTFSFILLFVLHFVGFYLSAMMWFDLEEEIDVGDPPSMVPLWFSAVPALRQLFNNSCCFTSNGLLTEFLCYLHHLARPYNRPGLLMILLESVVITIAYCLVLLDQIQNLFLYVHCILPFGSSVGEPTPFLFSRSFTFSSFRIKSGNDRSL